MVSKVKVLIIEDEFITINLLRDYLEKYSYEVSGDAINADEAIAILEKGETDIALLDINLKGSKNGIWIAEQIKEKYKIPFVFISAYRDLNTIKTAANTNPSGYLVKPFKDVNVFSAIEIALRNIAKNTNVELINDFETSEENVIKSGNFIFVIVNSTIRKISFTEIKYIQAFKNYLEINCFEQKVLIRYTLQGIYTILPRSIFTQVHRSFIVNVNFIKEIGSKSIELENITIPVSKGNREELIRKVDLL